MMVGSAAFYLQVTKYSELHDQRVQLRAPAQCNTAIYEDNLLLGLEATVLSRSGESVEINTQCLDKGTNTDVRKLQPKKPVLLQSAVQYQVSVKTIFLKQITTLNQLGRALLRMLSHGSGECSHISHRWKMQ